MHKIVASSGDQGGQVAQALMQVAGTERPVCARRASGGVPCQSGVCEEPNSLCMGTKVTDFLSGAVDRSTWGSLKVSPHLPSAREGTADNKR